MASDNRCVFCLFGCKIGLIILIDYINFAYLAVLLTKECIIELVLLSFRQKKIVYKTYLQTNW